MTNPFYQQELAHLRDLAVEFSRAHPALAPMLAGPTQDPDVERLLEGTAFLAGMLREKLADEFPEVIHGLTDLIFPHYLRPIPSATIVAFAPKPGLQEPLKVPAGTLLGSMPVEGTTCLFRTCYPVEVLPLRLQAASLRQQPGRPSALVLSFELLGIPLSSWQPSRLRLHLAGAYPEASAVFNLLSREVAGIQIAPRDGGKALLLPPAALRPVGFGLDEGLFPYPTHAFPGFRILQEYFVLPDKFLFLDLTELSRWQERGDGTKFEITFELKQLPAALPPIRREHFTLFATPVVNLFPHNAEPILLDHRQPDYRIRPSGGDHHHQVYSVDSVIGVTSGTVQKREYAPFELFTPREAGAPIYTVKRRISAVRQTAEASLSVAYPQQAGLPAPETLSLALTCTNALLPESLKLGDVSQPTTSSPELCEFRSIRPTTAPQQPPLGKNLLWRFMSHLSLNLLSLANPSSLQAMLRLYIFPDSRDRATVLANEKRITGIESLEVVRKNRLVGGINMRGQEIRLGLNSHHFAGPGDLCLFGCMLDHFLGTYAGINNFTHLKVRDSVTGDELEWPVRIGDRPLI